MRKLWLMLAAVALVVAGCGDDSDDASSDDTSSEDTSSEDTSADDSGGSSDAAAFLNDSNCNFVLSGGWANPMAGGLSPDGSVPDFDDIGDQFQNVADNAPDEIRSEFQLLAERYNEFLDLMGDADFSDPSSFQDPETQQALAQADSIFDEEFESAADAVDAYFQENCSS
ncbi:MAG: hypothetical protein U5K30_05010 [Acidimicrobiales bacterium]|nr:hypothetical protein [Acidimicrobiales bacterium]